MATSDRGFASMPKDKVKKIASKGGRSQGKENNSANFANNRENASRAGSNSHRTSNSDNE